MKFLSISLVAPALVCVGLLLAAGSASAAQDVNKPAKTKKHRVKVVKFPSSDSPYLQGSQETQTMRDRRLTRECRGAANGGACKGYTR